MTAKLTPTANQLHAREFNDRLWALICEAEAYSTQPRIATDHRTKWRMVAAQLRASREVVAKMMADDQRGGEA